MTVTINGTTGIAGVDGSAATPAVQGVDTNTGMFFPAADTIAFAEGGVEAMRINSSGQVGIGTTSPTAPLDVKVGTGNFTVGLQGTANTQLTATGTLRFDSTAGTTLFTQNTTESMRIASNGDLSFNSGYGSAAVAYACRAWVNFNGTGTVAIRGSGNVTSITDNGVGDYTVNFTTAMPDVNYCVSGTADRPSTAGVCLIGPRGTYSTSAVQMRITNSADAVTDPSIASVQIVR